MMNKVRLSLFSSALAACLGLSAQNDTTFVATGNPIVKYKYTADPGALVHDGQVYIYAGHDECPPPREHYLLNEWCVSIGVAVSAVQSASTACTTMKTVG